MSDDVGNDTTDDRIDGDEVYCPTCNVSFSPLIDFCPDDGTRLIRWRAMRDPLCGTIIDRRFQIVRPLGEGGMGRVYYGMQLSVDRPVAIKVIREHLSSDRTMAKRFLREARMLTGFNHPNIVNVFDFGQTETGELYLVMELLRGRTLAAELAMGGRFTPRTACEVAMQLCDALGAAHERGIVHRDLKPANVVLLDGPAVHDLVKVLDFGLAKSLWVDATTTTSLTEAGAFMGTPLYMAPEAIAGGAPDPRTDLYALGCILYELLAGVAPFADPAINVVLAGHLSEAPRPLPDDVPAELAELVYHLLAKSPEQRPGSAALVKATLQAFMDDESIEELPTMIHQPRLEAPAVPGPRIAPSPAATYIVHNEHRRSRPLLAFERRLRIVAAAVIAAIAAFAIAASLL